MSKVAYLQQFEAEIKKLNTKWKKLQDTELEYSYTVPDVSLKQCFNYWTERHPEKPYIIFQGKTYTYQECNKAARRIANGLNNLGYRKGDRLNTFIKNSPEFIMICQACFKLGIILVTNNPLDTPREFANKMKDSGAKIVVVDDTSIETMMTALKNTNMEKPDHIIYLNNERKREYSFIHDKGIVDFKTMLEYDNTELQVPVFPGDVQLLQYTGGTTGISKGCCLTNKGLLSSAMALASYLKPSIKLQDLSVLLSLPMFHAYGLMIGVLIHMSTGGNTVLLASQKPSVEEVLNAIEHYKPTCWPTVPVVLNSINKDDGLKNRNISSIRVILCGSSLLPLETIETFSETYGIKIRECYGLSEAGILTGMPMKKAIAGSVGIPLPNTEVLVVDLETGTRVLAPGEPGEIIGRGPQLMKEYWNKPEETLNVIRNGWLYTGDIGIMDDEGKLKIVDRKKDLIIVSGFNVYPREIEEILYTHAEIIEACTIGIPDEKRGEVPKAFIVKKKNSSITGEDIIRYCREYLSPYKVPRKIEFVDLIPKTKASKPDRKAMKIWDQETKEVDERVVDSPIPAVSIAIMPRAQWGVRGKF